VLTNYYFNINICNRINKKVQLLPTTDEVLVKHCIGCVQTVHPVYVICSRHSVSAYQIRNVYNYAEKQYSVSNVLYNNTVLAKTPLIMVMEATYGMTIRYSFQLQAEM